MKRIITLFLIVAVSSLTYAQEEAIVSVFQKDKTVVSVAREEVDSISYSRIDKNGILHESFVSQLIHTKDSTHRWLLNEVDSVTFEWMPDGEVTHDQVPRPRVWSRDANDITCNGATLRGKLRGADASAVSKLGFYVSQDYHEGRFGGTYYEASIDNSRWGTFSLPISGLVAAEKYYFRAVAVYKGRDFQGLVNSFRTEGVSVTTMSAEIKTPFSVMVGGSTDACHSDGMVCGFYYNTTGNPNADNAESVSAENTDNTFKRLIDDLRPATTYYLRAYVILDGKIFMGDVIKFKTPEFLITTLEAEPGSFTAKLKGCYMPESIEVDSVGFYYFTSPAIEAFPDFSNAISVSCTKALPSFEYQLTGLEPRVGRGDNPDDNYYVRAYADKNGERYVSTDFVRFSTEGIKLLTMSDTIIGGKPWFRGTIFYEGELDDADRWGGFLYRTTSNGITSDWERLLKPLSQLGNGDTFRFSPKALTPGCVVKYMAVYYSEANNHLVYGDIYSFTYEEDISVTALEPLVNDNDATFQGLVKGIDFSSDSIITAGFRLSLTQDFSGQESRVYTITSDDLNTSTGVFTSFVDHLPYSTDIYYYAFVEVNGQVYRSDTRTLRIPKPLSIMTSEAEVVDENTAVIKGHIEGDLAEYHGYIGFVYWSATDFSDMKNKQVMALSDIPAWQNEYDFSARLINLTPNKTYYYQAYVDTGAETLDTGNTESFTLPEDDNREWVDLGLPSGTLWATRNVGANSPEDYGDYFAWGETVTKDEYTWNSYKHCDGSMYQLTKYCTSSSYGNVDNKAELESEDDAATVLWGNEWQMPSGDQIIELLNSNYTNVVFKIQNGVWGRLITSLVNGASIFVPAGGYYSWTEVESERYSGYLWSRTLCTDYNDSNAELHACGYIFDIGCAGILRSIGANVRPVRKQQNDDKVRQIELTPTTLLLSTGESKQVTATIYPSGALNKDVTWESSDEDVAKVNSSGVVTALATGSCAIICRACDGSGVSAECQVTVFDEDGSHAWVDLDLPSGTLWATCNVGADSPEEYGDYFAWGETVTKDEYTWNSYKHCDGSRYSLTKYCTESSYGTEDGKTELEPADDAATALWGSDWQMPSREQLLELIDSEYTTTEWTQQNGISGILVTSIANNKSIFLPAAGDRSYLSSTGVGSDGQYWSRSLVDWDSDDAYGLGFSLYSYDAYSYNYRVYANSGVRHYGRTIRPVRSR